MNIPLKRCLVFLGETVRTFLMLVGVYTVHDFFKQRWPDTTDTGALIILAIGAGVFIWLVAVAPFLSGLREERAVDEQ